MKSRELVTRRRFLFPREGITPSFPDLRTGGAARRATAPAARLGSPVAEPAVFPLLFPPSAYIGKKGREWEFAPVRVFMRHVCT